MENKKVQRDGKWVIEMAFIPMAVIAFWFLAGRYGFLNESVLPRPAKVGESVASLTESGALWKHVSVSFLRVLQGYLIGAAAGLMIGILAALIRPLGTLLEVPIGLLRPIPAIALIPLFILWMGIGEKSKIAVIVFGSFWPVLLNTMQGIQGADRKLLEVGTILEKSRVTILKHIIFPSALPAIFTGLRLGVGNAWTCVVAAEMIAASAGIGFLITYSREMAQPASLLVGVTLIGLLGFVLDALLRWLNRRLIYWE